MSKSPFTNRPNRPKGSGEPEEKRELDQSAETEVNVTITTKKKRRVNRATSKDFAPVGARINKSAKDDWDDFVPKCKRKDGHKTHDEVIEAALMAFIKQRSEAWEKETPAS